MEKQTREMTVPRALRVFPARAVLALASAMAMLSASAVSASVFDDAKVWWKFDDGGANGAVAQKSEIHDARDGVTIGVPTYVRGQDGGPNWRHVTVALLNSRKTVECTALDFNVATNATQNWGDGLDFSDVAIKTDNLTFFARIRPGKRLVTTVSEYCLFNNIFTWGSAPETAYGHFIGLKWDGGAYKPYLYIARKATTFSSLTMTPDKWYEMAFSITLVGAQYRVLCVLCGEDGIQCQTLPIDFVRADGTELSSNACKMGGQGTFSSWQTTNGQYQSKNFNGLLHEMALWPRALTTDEIIDAFGRPAEKSDDDPFADAIGWWKFDRDIDGSGAATADEIRGVRTWGTDAAPGAGNPVVSRITTENAPKWYRRDVLLPARGETFQTDCLAFEPEWRTVTEGTNEWKDVRPAQMDFQGMTIVGSMTLLARVRITQDFVNAPEQFLYNNAHKYASDHTQGGRLFGFYKDTSNSNFVPRVFGGSAASSATIPMVTNTWYDVAWTWAQGTDESGGDAITVTVADAAHGIRVWSGTVRTNQFTQTEKNVRIGGQTQANTWITWRGADGKDTSGGATRKMFCGDVHQLAVWNRALSQDEVAMAMGYPRALFGVGSADGASGEFAPAGSGAYDYTVSDSWHGMAGTLDSSHRSLTLRYTPQLSWNGMAQGFRVRAATVGNGSQRATLSLSVNGKNLGAQTIESGADTWWWVEKSRVASGENVAVLTLVGGSPAVAIDKIDMSGSWALINGQGGTFTQDGHPQGDPIVANWFYVGDRNMAHLVRAVTANALYKTDRIHFYVPPYLAGKYEFNLSFTVVNCAVDGQMKLNLNGVEKGAWDSLGIKGKETRLTFEPGTLLPGWNILEPERVTNWTQFSAFRLSMRDPNAPFVMMIR